MSTLTNKISADGRRTLLRCFDGPLRGRHVWMDNNLSNYPCYTARWRGPARYESGGRAIADRRMRCYVYHRKTHTFGKYDVVLGRTVSHKIEYLSCNVGDPFDDVIKAFGPSPRARKIYEAN